MPKHRVLIVEDEQDLAGLINRTLERSGEAEAQIVGSGDAALKAVTGRQRRSKLRDADRQIETVVGLGYRFVD